MEFEFRGGAREIGRSALLVDDSLLLDFGTGTSNPSRYPAGDADPEAAVVTESTDSDVQHRDRAELEREFVERVGTTVWGRAPTPRRVRPRCRRLHGGLRGRACRRRHGPRRTGRGLISGRRPRPSLSSIARVTGSFSSTYNDRRNDLPAIIRTGSVIAGNGLHHHQEPERRHQ